MIKHVFAGLGLALALVGGSPALAVPAGTQPPGAPLSSMARLNWWARSFSGVKAIPVMGVTSGAAAAPTVTLPASTSSAINGSLNAASIPTAGKYPNLNCAGYASSTTITGNPNNNALLANGPANTDASLPGATLFRCRFTLTVPQFEVVFNEQTGAKINALVDGAFVTAQGVGVVPNGLQSGNTRYMKFDFGADAPSFGVASANVSAGGTTYAANDLITLSGGTCARAPTYRVGVVSSGAVTNLYIQDAGDCSALPSFPAATTTTGSGTGLTIAAPFFFSRHTTLKPREIELLIEGAYLFGINYTAPASGEAAISPYTFNPRVPVFYCESDSQDANTYGTYAGGEQCLLVALRLGLEDNIIIDARGGTGFNVASGTAGALDYSARVNAIIAAKPDILYLPYSQNVGGNNQATSQAACISEVNAIQAGSPNTLIVMPGPAFGAQSWHLAAMTACAAGATNPSHITLIDTITQGLGSGGSAGMLVNDAAHWGMYGNFEWRSKWMAEQVAQALLSMISPTGL